MTIRAVPIGKSPHKKQVKQLYHTAFPKEEQMPWWLLRLLTALGRSEITCYYHADILLGFTVSASTRQVLFVLFFAVESSIRGQGWGSGILSTLKETAGDRPILLNVEPLDETADNNPQRISRMRFYERNDFRETGYEIDEVGGTFRVLSSRPNPDMDAYLQAFKRISYGFWKPEIRAL